VLDLDDVGTEVRQQGPDDGSGDEHGRIDDLEPGQGPFWLGGGFHGEATPPSFWLPAED
jgi:hypothetical protein